MSPVPPTIFNEYGKMRETSKAQLIKKLGVKDTNRADVDVSIIDGNELIYHVVWPESTVSAFVHNFERAVVNNEHDMYVIFDKYEDDSIKMHE